MRISRILNNNAIVATDDSKQEVVVLGRGLAFQKAAGDIVSEDRVQKIFYPTQPEMAERLIDTFGNIFPKFIDIADTMIDHAQTMTGKKFSDDIYVTLPDHLQFAVQRQREGLVIRNRLLIETMQSYPDEFAIGQRTVALVNKEFDVELPPDEAANIAMHFITAEGDSTLDATYKMIQVINEIVALIEREVGHKIDRESVQYYRLMTHLKFYLQRVQKQTKNDKIVDPGLYAMIIDRYHKSYLIACQVAQLIEKDFKYKTTDDELMYLTIHIQRISE